MKYLISIATLLILPISSSAQDFIRSLPKVGGFSLTPEFGVDKDNSKFSNTYRESFTGAGTLFGQSLNATVTFNVASQDFNDVFDKALNYGASLNYGLSDSTEIFGRFKYTRADAKLFDAMNVNANVTFGGVTVSGSDSIKGKMDDYSSYGFEVGSRFFLDTKSAFKPYISPSVGITRVDDLNVQLSYNGSNIGSALKFYDSTWVYNLGIGAGFRYDISQNIAAGLETGYRYQSSLDENNADLGSSGINNRSKRNYIPLSAGINISF
jgi:hypothetical protein